MPTSQEGTALDPGHQQAHLGAGPSAQVGLGSSDPRPALPPAGQDHGPGVELPALKQELVHPPRPSPAPVLRAHRRAQRPRANLSLSDRQVSPRQQHGPQGGLHIPGE